MNIFLAKFIEIIIQYQIIFSKPVFEHVKLMVSGAMLLATGKHTVSSVLQIMGLSQEKNFHKYHRVLSLAHWSVLQGSHILLIQLLNCFLPTGPIVVGIDEAIERKKEFNFSTSENMYDMIKIPKPLLLHFQHILAHVA